ncbi:MAG TPA: DUF3568 family protein [Tepidisphaeraceae bacterium]|jgi:hypothetical protein|nr:DUF3568 family protein [Tepidisphaeraceae bacterium]
MTRALRPKAHALWIISLLPLLGCTGCVALPLATLGTVLGVAGTAATTGSDVYNLGKLDFSVMATFDECRFAAVDAANDLQLHIRGCKFVGKRKDELKVELADDLNRSIAVRIDRRAARLCQCRVDVGLFGSEPTAKVIMQRIRRHLPKTARETKWEALEDASD